jgi:hypothetical protein
MHEVSSRSSHAYVLQSQTGTVNLFHIWAWRSLASVAQAFCIIAQAPSPKAEAVEGAFQDTFPCPLSSL